MNDEHTNNPSEEDVVILGGGLAGLSSGYVLAKNSRQVCVVESGDTVGGLSRTVAHNGFP